jgi:hypothetical protein
MEGNHRYESERNGKKEQPTKDECWFPVYVTQTHGCLQATGKYGKPFSFEIVPARFRHPRVAGSL